MKNKSRYFVFSLVLLAVLFASLSVLSGRFLQGMRADLSENKLYTLSEGTRNILDELQEPVNLYLYFSEQASRDLPQIRSYAKRVDELLSEIASRSKGKVRLYRENPEPFSEKEDEASQYGLQAVPIDTSGTTLYLGIAGSNSLDDVQTIPFLQPAKEKFLEYDLAKMISTLGNPERKTIGLLSSLPMSAGYEPTTQAMREAWVIHDQLSQLFEIENIDAQEGELPEELDVLVLVHPRDLNQALMYQIDQFVLGGGRLLVFVDPLAESDRGDPADPMGQMQAGSSSELGPLLDAWGIEYDSSKALGDLQFGIGSGPQRHIGIISVPAEGLNADDIVSADLETINFSSTGWFSWSEDASANVESLVQSSENAAPLDAMRLRFLSNPADLLSDFNPTGERYALGVRLSGQVSSAYESAPEGLDASLHLSDSGESGINVMLFADTDMLTDRLWVQKQDFLGQNLASAFADNGSIVVNAVDNLLGNRNLISIRTRASSVRPFDRVTELQLQAEKKYRATEESLQQELAETERILTELQAARAEEDLLVLTPEQQNEVQRFMDRKLEIRKELREVQHDLQVDINSLGTRLKLFNIVLVPLLVIVMAVVYGLRRRQYQNESRARVKQQAKN